MRINHVKKSIREWQWFRNRGYGQKHWNGKTAQAHVLAFLLAGGVLTDEKNCVLHSCDNPPCCNPNHLRAGSRAENNQEAYDRNMKKKGSAHYIAKLKEEDIPIIRSLRRDGMSFYQISKRFGVSMATIKDISDGKSWKHVKE
jgi:hypothetical protein